MKKALLEKGEPTTWKEFLDHGMRRLFDALIKGGSQEMRMELHSVLTYFLTWHPRAMEVRKRMEKEERKRVP